MVLSHCPFAMKRPHGHSNSDEGKHFVRTGLQFIMEEAGWHAGHLRHVAEN